MDIKRALDSLGFIDEGFDPASDLSTYETTVATWRHTVKSVPLESAITAELEAIDLADAKDARKGTAIAFGDTKAYADFTHGGKTYDATAPAQGQISFAIAYGQLSAVADVTTRSWTLADNSTVSVSWGDLRAMATALFERNDAYHANLQTHKSAIDALGTVEAIEAYDITTGW